MCKATRIHQDFGCQVGFSQTAPERPISREKLASESPEPRDATWGLLGCRRELWRQILPPWFTYPREKGWCISRKKWEDLQSSCFLVCVVVSRPFVFLVLVFGCALPPLRLSAPAPARRLTHNLLTHNLTTHNLSTHNLLTHTQLDHTHLASCHHTTWPHTTCHHTTCSHTTCPHATYSHTQLDHTHLASCHHTTWPHTQAWHLATSAFTLHGRRGTWRNRPSLCVAGVALRDIDLHFAW